METNLNVMKTSLNHIDLTLLFTRVILAVVVFAHGAQKLFGWFGGYGFEGSIGYFTESVGLPYGFALLIILAESLGMILLVLGILTRVWSAAVILIMLGAIVQEHGQFGFFMNWSGAQGGEGFEFHLLVMVISFVPLIHGGGAYSLDNVAINARLTAKKKASLV